MNSYVISRVVGDSHNTIGEHLLEGNDVVAHQLLGLLNGKRIVVDEHANGRQHMFVNVRLFLTVHVDESLNQTLVGQQTYK